MGFKGREWEGRIELDQVKGRGKNALRHFFVLWYWIDVSPAMFKMLISKEIVDGN